MAQQNKLHGRIMRRVYGVWFARTIAPILAAELIVLAVSLTVFRNQVFVQQTMANAFVTTLGNPLKILAYFGSAFLTTHAKTQIISVILVAAGMFFLKDIKRATASYAVMRKRQLSHGILS